MKGYISGEQFNKINFAADYPEPAEFEDCVFTDCPFAEGDLSGYKFISCEFIRCDLSMVKLAQTVLSDCVFLECKMLGLHFTHCNPFGFKISVTDCILNHSSFYKVKLKQVLFRRTHLVETDFTEADLTQAVFDACELSGATFEQTNLEQTDFRTAVNYVFDPSANRVKKTKVTVEGLPGLVQQFDLDVS